MCKDVYKYGVNVREFNEQHWEFIRNLTVVEYNKRGLNPKGTRAWYKCNHCGEVVVKRKQVFKTSLSICQNGCMGAKYGSNVVLRGVNDVATTHPYLVKYFVNKEESHLYSVCSNQRIEVKCNECNQTKFMQLNNLFNQGFSCPICSDGISYPEKLVASFLRNNCIGFIREYSLDEGNTRFDFYIPTLNMIIETHGIQHYEQTSRKGDRVKSLEEEQENDKYKRELASRNGIKHYIVLDCRYSTLDFIKMSIVNSEILTLLNLKAEIIDWVSIASLCERSMVREVCEYYNANGGTPRSISEKFGVVNSTIANYLKRGTELGWCNYSEEVRRQNLIQTCRENGYSNGKPVKGVDVKTGSVVAFPSVLKAVNWLITKEVAISSLANANISSCAKGRKRTAYGYVWDYITDEEYSQINQCDNLKVEIPTIVYGSTAKSVKGVHKETGEVVIFKSATEAGDYIGGSQGNISMCCNGKRKSAYGYVWSYID